MVKNHKEICCDLNKPDDNIMNQRYLKSLDLVIYL